MAWDYTNDYSSTILAYTSGAGAITVVSVTGLPASGKYFILKVDDEYFLCTSYIGLVLTVTGGQASSTPANHSLGATITGCWIVPQVLDGIKSDVIASVALVLLEQHTASNSASLDFTTWYSSAYDQYVIEVVGLIPSSNNDLQMLISGNGGLTWGSSIYSYSLYYQYSGGAGVNSANGQAAWLIAGSTEQNSSVWAADGTIKLFHPGSTTLYPRATIQMAFYQTYEIYCFGGMTYRGAGAINAFRILAVSGNLDSGTVRVYGVAKV